jgi:hypothetical protein
MGADLIRQESPVDHRRSHRLQPPILLGCPQTVRPQRYCVSLRLELYKAASYSAAEREVLPRAELACAFLQEYFH